MNVYLPLIQYSKRIVLLFCLLLSVNYVKGNGLAHRNVDVDDAYLSKDVKNRSVGLEASKAAKRFFSTVGTSVAITSGGSQVFGPVAVGSGVEHDLAGDGSATKLFNVDPVNSTITLSMAFNQEWAVAQFEAVFSGGTLGQITSITRTGGTASNAANYSASASGKTVTFNVPPSPQNANGTVIFTFTSTSTSSPTLVNNGVSGTIGWDAITTNEIVAGAIAGQTPGGLISVTNHLSSGFDIYAKNNSNPSSQNFTMRNQTTGIPGASGAPFVRIVAVNSYTPEWLELRANQGIFDLSSIKVGSADNISAATYDYTLQALDSSFNPTGTPVTLNSVTKLTYGTFSVSSNTDFDGIYGVRIKVNTGLQIAVDDIAVTNPRMPDNTPPTVASVNSSTANGTYKVGDVISIQANFSETVTVTGTPQLTLETGTTDRVINYASGSGTSSLTFSYTIQAGDSSSDLDYVATNSLALNGGTIKDPAGNNAVLTLPTPGAANSLGANKNFVIDGDFTLSINDPSMNEGNSGNTNMAFTVTINQQSGFNTTFNYVTTAGTATAGNDYVTTSGTATVLANTSSVTINVPIIGDELVEPNETFIVTLSSPSNSNSTVSLAKAIGVGTIVNDDVAPVVSSISSSTANGTYKVGDVIAVTGNFSKAVTVTGTPQLTLETGSTDRVVNYSSGSGTSTLTFNYTIQGGDNSNDLDYVATNSLALNGGTIRDVAGNNATLTLSTPGLPNSLGANKNLVIDGVSPSVSSVNSSTANGTYKIGDVISIQVNFNENVTVTGTPQLTLETGSTDQVVNYASGSGTSSLTFSYTVQAGDSSSDLDYVATGSLALNGGTIKDPAGNNATLTLPTPGAANSLGNNKALVIEGIVPTVTIGSDKTTLKAGETATLTFTLSESSTNFILGDIIVTGGLVSNLSGSGTSYTATFTPTANSTNGAAVEVAGGAFTDAAGNGNTAATPLMMTVDTQVPTITIGSNKTALTAGETATLTFTLSESSTNFILGDITATGGVVSNLSGSGTSYTATFTPTANSTNGAIVDVAGGVFTDAAGNGNTAATQLTMTVDTTIPTVTSVNSVTANGTYKVGDVISIQVNFSETVIVTGTPQLTLETGTTDRVINYASGNVTSTLTFNYTIQAGDTSADLDYLNTNALALNVGTIRDAAGNNAVLTLPVPGDANSLGNNKALVIDGIVPTVASVNSVIANGTYKINDVISVQVNFSKAVTVTGTPQLTLETGATDRTISYASGSGTSTLTFSYTVQAGDNSNDLDYVATSSLALNGGTIRDAAGNNATLTLATPGQPNSLGANKNFVIDGVVPSVTSTAPVGGSLSTDISVNFTVNFSESVSNISTDDFALGVTGSATGTIASVSASSGTTVDVTVSGITGNGTIKLNVNASTNIADAAGNSSPAAYTSGTTHTVAIPTAPSAPTIGTATAGDAQATVTFTAPVSNGGSAITGYTVTSSPGGITAGGNGFTTSPITVTGLTNGTAYTFKVTATNAIGTSTASGASNAVTPKGNQTITFPNPGAQNFGTTPNLGSTVSATSSLTVSFTSSTPGVCTITSEGTLTFSQAGSCTIEADQAGNTAWNAATTVPRTFTVNAVVPSAPTIGTATAGDTEATVTFTAPASTGGSAIIASGYTVTANPGGATATGSNSPITVTGLTNGVNYTFTVTATNSAGESASSSASNGVIPKGPQNITFGNPGTQDFGTTPTLTASSSAGAGYPVSFTSSTTGICTITTGGALTFLTTGSCTINANQAGGGAFLAAGQVSQTFTVAAVVPAAPTIGTATSGDTQAQVTFTAPVFTGGANITTYTVTSIPEGLTKTGVGSPIVVTGLTNGVSYKFTVTATNSAGTGSASGESNSITPKAEQIITFIAPIAQNFGTTPTLTATSDSGLTPVFTSATTGVCTITTGGALSFITTGTCTINANQPGNGSYLAAPQISHSFNVNAVVPGAPTAVTAIAGNAQATVSFTAPASTGGAAITGYTVTVSPGGATVSGSTSPIVVNGLTNGTNYTFTVKATNSVGSGLASLPSSAVKPNGPPNISGTPVISVTEGTAYSFTPTAADSPGDVLTFSIINRPAWASFNTTTGMLTGIPLRGNAGSYGNIVISVSDGTLSSSLPAFTITVEPAPVLAGITFTAASFVYDGSPKSLAISGTLPAGTTVSYTGNGQTNAGTYTVRANISGGTNYQDQVLTATLTISKIPVTGISFAGANYVYDGTARSLAINGTLPAGVTVSYTNNGQRNAGTYTVTANVNAGNNYQDQALTAQLAISKVPLTITASNASMCQGANLPTFAATYNGFIAGETESSLSVRPNFNTTANSSSATGNYVVTPSGAVANNYQITYINASLTINPKPIVSISSDKGLTVAKGETVVLTATGGTSYVWANASGIVSGQNMATLSVRPTVNTTYSVTALSATGCTASQSIAISVTEDVVEVKPTNIVTLNGDGVNDKWVIANIDLYPNNEVKVFDKGGRIVYSKKRYDNDWDGTLRGLPLTRGTYYYTISFGDGKTPAKSGYITILGRR